MRKNARFASRDWRHAAIDLALVRVNLGLRKPYFIAIVITGRQHPTQDVTHLGLVIDKPQQGFSMRALPTDAENVFRGRIHADDKQIIVQQHDAAA